MRRIPNIVNVDRLVVASQFFPICFTISMTSKRSSGSARVGVCGAPVNLPMLPPLGFQCHLLLSPFPLYNRPTGWETSKGIVSLVAAEE